MPISHGELHPRWLGSFTIYSRTAGRSATRRATGTGTMDCMFGRLATLVLAALLLAPAGLAAESATPAGLEFFESKIRPVLANNCYACHSAEAKTRMGGLSLDTRDGIREGGQRGHAVVPSDVHASLIVEALRYDGALRMPPSGRLSDEVIQNFEEWIRMGAPDPRETEVRTVESKIDLEQGRKYWAFQAPARAALPAVQDQAWPEGAIDRYVLAALESKGLRPVRDARRADLLRRITLDLTGLPPKPNELERFLRDDSEDAYATVVDRLLESDRFGERWGRHWLDIVRYADSVGRTRNLPFPVAWKYRDYVIRAFNDDKPYDDFIREQIAGDLLPYSDAKQRNEQLIATGFLALGAHDLAEGDAKQFDMDVADEMINVTTRAILALSVGCARCHDHKFDPIPTEDYYALAGIFRSSEVRNGLRRRPRFNAGYFHVGQFVKLDGVPEFSSADGDQIRAERERLWEALHDAEKERDRQKSRQIAREIGKLPMPENLAMGVAEAGKPVSMRVNVGGDPHTLGEPVQRGFVQALFPTDARLPRIGRKESGRLQLAEWLTRPDNPLTARVLANRLWHHMLGKGIVPTVDNFGAMGRQPTNGALLGYLAVQLVEYGWSVKSLIREVALSRTYRLSSAMDRANFSRDPDNDYLWRANVRRLDAESVRDAVLAVSGELGTEASRPSPVNDVERNQQFNARNKLLQAWVMDATHRSVYLPVVRNHGSRIFEAFDFPEPSETKGARDVTTSPSQALFMMNSDFVRTHAGIAAERLVARTSDDRERVRYAFRQALSRDPSGAEEDKALEHVRTIERALISKQPSPEDRAAARSWLAGLLAALLDRDASDVEIDAAMDYLVSMRSGAAGSVAAASGALMDEEGRLERGVTQALIAMVLGRDLNREERAVASKNLRRWRSGERKRRVSEEAAASAVPASPEHEAWSRMYHALYNSAEFRYRN